MDFITKNILSKQAKSLLAQTQSTRARTRCLLILVDKALTSEVFYFTKEILST